jgi:DNA repair photolyase
VASPARRIKTIAKLAAAGLSVGVNVAPIIPGLNDSDIPLVLEAAYAAGARSAGRILVRLPGPVEAVFMERLRAALPLRAERILHQIEACRGGHRSDPRFGHRFSGTGARWEVITALFEQTAKRLGYGQAPSMPDPSPFRRPASTASGQLPLF